MANNKSVWKQKRSAELDENPVQAQQLYFSWHFPRAEASTPS